MKGEFDLFLTIIGALVVSIIFMAIPILCACSFCLNWWSGAKFLLLVSTAIEFLVVFSVLGGIGITDEK